MQADGHAERIAALAMNKPRADRLGADQGLGVGKSGVLTARAGRYGWFYRREQAKRAEVGVLVDDPLRENAAMKALGVMKTRNGAGL